MKQYKYTIYKQDGTIEVLPISKKKDFEELYKILNCSIIEIIPSDYYPAGFGHSTVYGDEEGRFNENNHRNPHFKVLADGWDVVGNVIREEVYHKL